VGERKRGESEVDDRAAAFGTVSTAMARSGAKVDGDVAMRY
jgi:hypothetical protein